MQSALQYEQTYFFEIALLQAVVLEEVEQEVWCGSVCAKPKPKYFPLSYSVGWHGRCIPLFSSCTLTSCCSSLVSQRIVGFKMRPRQFLLSTTMISALLFGVAPSSSATQHISSCTSKFFALNRLVRVVRTL